LVGHGHRGRLRSGGGAQSKTIKVTLKDSVFSPTSVSAHVGDTIVWTNAGQMPHTVTAADKSFDQQLMPGATFRLVLRKEGTIPYVCTYHPGMKGTLVVGPAPAGVTLPPAGSGGTVSGNGAAAKPAAAAPPPAAKTDGTKTYEIKATEMAFTPKMLDARVGDTVSWVNTGTIPHTVTAKDGSFDKTLQPGQRFNYVLRKEGTVDYVCTFHPGMDGMLMVKAAAKNVKLPAAGADDSAAGPAAPAVHRHGSSTTYEVQAKDDAFSPALLDVRAGDTVVWVNVGATPHRVKAADGSFDRTLAPGKRFSLTLDRTGTVRYADPAHEGMFGALVVRAAPVSSTSASGPLAGLPLRTTGAVAVLGLLGLLAGGRVLRGRYDLADDGPDGADGPEAGQDADPDDGPDGRLLGADADQDAGTLESV
uniref:cupredoxin domain-containing protein n=1 Tax=Kineosporia sp. R_H_3 TaxID=1961848 RepID=UPI00117B0F4E